VEDKTKTDHAAVTVLARARERGLNLTPGQLSSIGRRAAAIYRKVYEADPERTPELLQPAPLSQPDLVVPSGVFAYKRPDVPMIDAAIDSVLQKKPAPVKVTNAKRKANAGPKDPELLRLWRKDVLLILALGAIAQRPKATTWIKNFTMSVGNWVRKLNRPLTERQRATVKNLISEHMRKREWDKIVAEWKREFGESVVGKIMES
jgi:hypothetical protein